MAYGRLRLEADEVDIVLDVEAGLSCVDDLPVDDGGDLHRVADGVVDLEHVAVEVVDATRHRAAGGERVDPMPPVAADGALVPAEEYEHAGDVGLHQEEPVEHHNGDGDQGDTDAGYRVGVGRCPTSYRRRS